MILKYVQGQLNHLPASQEIKVHPHQPIAQLAGLPREGRR